MGRDDHDDHGDVAWQSKDLPDDPRAAFRIINDWAKALQEWNIRVRSMSAITEVTGHVSPGQFARVVASVKAGAHSPVDIKKALDGTDREVATSAPSADDPGMTAISGATDVVGHPPDPPFTDPATGSQ